MILDDHAVAKVVFIERSKGYFNIEGFEAPGDWSIVGEMMAVAQLFGIVPEIRNMVERGHFYEKSIWKKLIWDKAWTLENLYWRIETNLSRSLDVLSLVNPNPRYLIWWSMSDRDHTCMYLCETMALIVCHASLLKIDDLRLKGQPRIARLCSHCDHSTPENAEHVIMQCPNLQMERALMFTEIDQVTTNADCVIFEAADDILSVLLGKAIENLPELKR